VVDQPFRHLGATGVVGTKEKYALFHRVGLYPL
jgi:hypothetical protein